MDFILEPPKKVPVVRECDVLVAGGGITGISAALAAARAGARVLLLEKEFALGGLATLGLVTIYLPLCDGRGRQVSFGISEELLRLSIRYGAEGSYPDAWLDEGADPGRRVRQRFLVQYNPHLFAILAERLLREAGVQILYGTLACETHKSGGRIEAVIVENKSGRTAIQTKSVVDATGDADICHLAGAGEAVYGHGNILAGWYYCHTGGKVKLKMLGFSDTPDEEKTEDTPEPLADRRFTGLAGDELSEMMQLSHDATLADILERRQQDEAYTPVTLAAIPQIRMTRRLDGRFTLDDKDMHKRFDDSIGMIGDWRKRGPVYELPFRTLYGGKVDNLLVAGRCMSVTDAMWDISRAIPACAVTGEAAGAAAAMGGSLRGLDVERLQRHLLEQGGRLHLEELP